MASRGARLRALAAVPLLALLAACGGQSSAGTAELTAVTLDPPFEMSSTPLVTTDGSSFSLTDDTDKDLTLVFFGYTHCPDICGQVMATLAGTLSRLDDAQKERLDVVFVTTDPTRDDGDVVADYVDAYDPSIIGLTGDLADITTVASSVKVAIGYFDAAGTEIPADELGDRPTYDVEHGTQVFGLDADDDVTEFWRADVSQAQLAHDVTALLDQG